MKNTHPGKAECLKMLEEYHTPENVIRHCAAVTDAALKIASALVEKGFSFDVELIQAACLLHDIARVKDEHWHVGADFALNIGLPEEAEIIRKHMRYPLEQDVSRLREIDLVCLGDRLILEDKYVGLEARMDYVIKKADGDKRVEGVIRERMELNKVLIRNIEEIIGVSLADLILGKGNREGE